MWPGKYFRRSEFECKCGCGFDTVDAQLLDGLDWIRDRIHFKLIVNSGCRCPKHNREIGGAKKSQHLLGRAADIRPTATAALHSMETLRDVVFAAYDHGYFNGLGLYNTFIHVDTRSKEKAFWDERRK